MQMAGDAAPKNKKTPKEAGYAQGQADENMLAGSQDVEPDVSSNQGEVLDNTNIESVQLQKRIMTRKLFGKTSYALI